MPQDTFELFYRANVRLVYAAALAQTASPAAAEDLTQETFLRAWQNLALLSALALPAQRGWLLRTVRNVTVDVFRQEARRTAREEVEGGTGLSEGAAVSQASALRVDVARALATLRTTDREMVVLRYFGEMNSREIGEALGVPEGTVRQRLASCRQTLSEQLAAWGVPEGHEESES